MLEPKLSSNRHGGWRSEAMGGGEYHSYPRFGWPDLARDVGAALALALALAALAAATRRAARAALALGMKAPDAVAAATWRAAHPQRCCSRGGATAEVGARACGSRKQLRRRAMEREVAQVSLGLVRKFHSGSLGSAEKVSLSAGSCCSCGARGRSLQRLRPCSRRRGSLPRCR